MHPFGAKKFFAFVSRIRLVLKSAKRKIFLNTTRASNEVGSFEVLMEINATNFCVRFLLAQSQHKGVSLIFLHKACVRENNNVLPVPALWHFCFHYFAFHYTGIHVLIFVDGRVIFISF